MTDTNSPSPAQFFIDMAARISRNEIAEFGGCVLVVAPGGQVVDMLMVGSKPDEVHFWAAAKQRVSEAADAAVFELEAKHRGQQPFRNR